MLLPFRGLKTPNPTDDSAALLWRISAQIIHDRQRLVEHGRRSPWLVYYNVYDESISELSGARSPQFLVAVDGNLKEFDVTDGDKTMRISLSEEQGITLEYTWTCWREDPRLSGRCWQSRGTKL